MPEVEIEQGSFKLSAPARTPGYEITPAMRAEYPEIEAWYMDGDRQFFLEAIRVAQDHRNDYVADRGNIAMDYMPRIRVLLNSTYTEARTPVMFHLGQRAWAAQAMHLMGFPVSTLVRHLPVTNDTDQGHVPARTPEWAAVLGNALHRLAVHRTTPATQPSKPFVHKRNGEWIITWRNV